MIYCTVNGGTPKEKYLIEQAFDFSLKELMPRKQNLDVDIYLTEMTDDAEGYHYSVGAGEHNIEVQRGLPKDDLITLIFHEMVHVRQHESGHLIDNGIVKSWKGQEYITVFSTVDEYMALPWEEEAYRLQEELFEKWNSTTMNTVN